MNRIAFAAALATALALSLQAAAQESPLVAAAMVAVKPADATALLPRARAAAADRDLATGILEHNLALSGEKGAADKAAASLKAAVVASPKDSLALAYYGSAITLQASVLIVSGDAVGASAKLSEGFALLDRALAAEKAGGKPRLALLFLHAENSVCVSESSPFDRSGLAQSDLTGIRALGTALSPEEESRWRLLSARVSLLKGDLDSGMAELEKAIQSAPKSGTADEARALLAQYEE